MQTLTEQLIRCASVTPDDAGCQALIGARLAASGFRLESMRFGAVDNLWASHGAGAPVLCFLGHTDVVPSGPVEQWTSPPFAPNLRDGRLYGRGAADMKGSVAGFVLALERLVQSRPDHPGTLALLLTSDEEGDAFDGVRRVAEQFRAQGRSIDACVVGEPTAAQQLGDVVRVGRRGSLSATLRVIGVQGHVAYPDQARNPIHLALPALQALVGRQWDPEPYPDFPPTGLQIANFTAGTGASNVIPGEARVQFNLRYSPHWTAERLIATIESLLSEHGLEFAIDWHRSGEPFYTAPGRLRQAVGQAIRLHCDRTPEENTGGGTSDGRFIAPLGAEVVEVGPVNASIHKIDEHIALDELERLPGLYAAIAEAYWAQAASAD